MIRRALFCTLSKAMQRYCGKFAKTTDAYSRTVTLNEELLSRTMKIFVIFSYSSNSPSPTILSLIPLIVNGSLIES